MSTMTNHTPAPDYEAEAPAVRECGGCEDSENSPHAPDCKIAIDREYTAVRSSVDSAAMRALAQSLVSTDPESSELSCSACGWDSIDVYEHAHDDTIAEMVALFEHCAFDHATRADVLVRRVVRIIRWER